MIARLKPRTSDFFALHCIFGAAVIELAIRELYHRVAAEGLVGLGMVWLLTASGAVICVRHLPERHKTTAARLAVLVAFCTALWCLFSDRLGLGSRRHSSQDYLVVALTMIVLTLICLQIGSAEARWSRIRRSVVAGCVLFVAAQPILVALRAPSLSWPPGESSAVQPGAASRSITVFLLLDELNATSSAPFVALLEGMGLQVRVKSLMPAGDGTAKVIPAMFTGLRFDQPKPCSPTAVCSGGNTLDFARVTASRPDVDVVGFFQPYCSMHGLRYCVRPAMARPSLFSERRWACALWRRTGMPRTLTAADCERDANRVWFELVQDAVDGLLNAPVWTKGGFLFAHLPLPHPPGPTAGAPLQVHYRENIDRALGLVKEIVTRSRKDPRDHLRLVIFSDHPLRASLWCKAYAPEAAARCSAMPVVQDTHVPLIVAGGAALPAIDSITSNDQVFSLVSRWR